MFSFPSASQSITVKELVAKDNGEEEWMTFEQKLPLSRTFSEEWEKELVRDDLPIKKSYRLDAVVSFIRTTAGALHSSEGHHVVHVRSSVDHERKMLMRQLQRIEKILAENEQTSKSEEDNVSNMTLISDISLQERKDHLHEQLKKLSEKETRSDQWLLLNGFVVTKVNSDDVRSFNAKFKEPSIVLFRETVTTDDDRNKAIRIKPNKALSGTLSKAGQQEAAVPVSVMGTTSMSNGQGPKITKFGK